MYSLKVLGWLCVVVAPASAWSLPEGGTSLRVTRSLEPEPPRELDCAISPRQWAGLGALVGFEASVLLAAGALASGDQAAPAARIPALDGLKSLLVLCVVVFHTAGMEQGMREWPRPVGSIFANGYPAMGLFFAVSGYVAAVRQEDWTVGATARMYVKRAASLGIPYWTVIGLSILSLRGALPQGVFLYTWLLAMAGAQAWMPMAVCGGSSIGIHNGPSWFLSALVPCLLVLPLLDCAAHRVPPGGCVALLATICALRSLPTFFLQSRGGLGDPDVLYYFPLMRVVEFAAGVLAARISAKSWQFRGVVTDFLCAMMLLTLAFDEPKRAGDRFGPLDGLFLAESCALVILLSAGEGLVARALSSPPLAQWFAWISYEVFLLHIPLVGFLGFAGIRPELPVARVATVLGASVFVATAAAALRMPVSAWIGKKFS